MSKAATRRSAVGLLVLRVLLGTAFLLAAGLKLAGHPMMVAEFERIGLGQGFRLLTGLVEAAGALMLLSRLTVFPGALVLLAVCVGAFVAQVGPLHGDIVHVAAMGLPLLPLAWASRPARLRRAN